MSIVFEGSREDYFPDLMSWAQENGASCDSFTVADFGTEGYGLRATKEIKVSSTQFIFDLQEFQSFSSTWITSLTPTWKELLLQRPLATLFWILKFWQNQCVYIYICRQRNYSCGFPGRCWWRWSRPRTLYWVRTSNNKYITLNYYEKMVPFQDQIPIIYSRGKIASVGENLKL